MKRIAIDMDEVMADFSGKVLETFNARFETDHTKEDMSGTNLIKLYPELQREIYGFISAPDFFSDLPVMPGSVETIKALHEHYEIIIATAAMVVPSSFEAKYQWLKTHFDFLDDQHFVFCGDKSVINADYLIDDNLHQLESFNNTGIMFTAAHNINIDYDFRLNSWEEVRDYFLPQTAEVAK